MVSNFAIWMRTAIVWKTAAHPKRPEARLGRLRLVAAGVSRREMKQLLGVREVRAGARCLAELVQHMVRGCQCRGCLARDLRPCTSRMIW